MLPDLSNFTVAFPSTRTLSATLVSLENLLKKYDALSSFCTIQELQYDNATHKFHVRLRVKQEQEEAVTLSVNDSLTSFVIKPIQNIRPTELADAFRRLLATLQSVDSQTPHLQIERLKTTRNELILSLPSQGQNQVSSPCSEEPSVPSVQRVIPITPDPSSLMVIDGNSLYYRAYFASSYKKNDNELMRDENGEYIGACKVFLELLGKYLKRYQPTHLAVAWDNPDDTLPNFRKKLYEPYKQTREEKPLPFLQQFHTLRLMLQDMGIVQVMDESGEYEADDLVGTLATWWKEQTDGKVYIISNDKDLFQLLDERTTQLMKVKHEEVCYTLQDFQKEYDLAPLSWIDCKAMMGDSSDNYKGIQKIGEKATFHLLRHYQTLDNLYHQLEDMKQNAEFKKYTKYLEADKEHGYLCKTLATIVTTVSLPSINDVVIDLKLRINQEQKRNIFKRLGYV